MIHLVYASKNEHMKIHVYAALKEHFEPEFELDGVVRDTTELKARLLAINDRAAGLLEISRFAVADGFIDADFKLKEYDTVVIIPPASGG